MENASKASPPSLRAGVCETKFLELMARGICEILTQRFAEFI